MAVSDPQAVKTQSNGWHGVWAFATSSGNQGRRGGDLRTTAFPERQAQHACFPRIPHLTSPSQRPQEAPLLLHSSEEETKEVTTNVQGGGS